MAGDIGKPPKCKHVYPGGKKCEGETHFYSEWVCFECGNTQEMHWRPGQRTLTQAALKEQIAALTEQLAEARQIIAECKPHIRTGLRARIEAWEVKQ